MNINLRDYQQESYTRLTEELEKHRRVLCVLPTGAGKSVVIGYLAEQLTGRTLILTHRIEIWKQNSAWVKDIGLLNSKVRNVSEIKKKNVVISMAQTLDARIKKHGVDYIGHFDNIITDEVHVDIFKKVYSRYNFKKLIGFTATPITNKVETKTVNGIEYKRALSMNRDFDVLVQTISEQDLVDRGFLTQDFNVALQLPNMDKLKSSEATPDGYTTQSINEVYSNTVAFDILFKGYDRYCRGKKTMIFNSTTKVNKNLYDYLKSKELNVRLYDSVNQTGSTRQETIDWFKGERDAILINANVFTTGFDVTDVEVIIVNRATKSLSLWLQMVGRGSRITDIVFKDKFVCIDLGMNIIEHGRWSKVRDWSEYFNSNEWKKKNKSDLLSTWECKECGFWNLSGELMTDDGIVCASCGELKKSKKKKDKDGALVELDKPKPPTGWAIIEYTRRVGGDGNFAFRLTEQKLLDLYDNVDKKYFIDNRGRLLKRTAKIFLPIYFTIIKSDLKGKNRRLKTQGRKLIDKILKKYD